MAQEGSEILFAGSFGKLHGYYYDVPGAKSVALVLPPHPKHGGTMRNKVVKTIYSCFTKRGLATLRMNYRGVGYSSGQVSVRDEDLIKDANAAIEWLQSCYPLVSSFWVAGFSYGAWLSLNLVMRRPEISGFVAVASPLKIHDFSFLSPCTVSGLMIQGDQDQLCDIPELLRLTSPISQRLGKFRVEFIENADFRMSGESNLRLLEQKIDDYLAFASTPPSRVYDFSDEVDETQVHSDVYAEEQLLVDEQI
ncbi:alpha/beta hydrolase family protein [Neorickettsia helminthoeca str. Oregon]|uniref:Alpha/beta hydrolase family protein n=2 Tax=Neorickettsia helminthoeca TaxID=33994 RepID=X5GXI2_9RICK|nr:alpha/beta hydrolase family protein [Neorickettsia helminthoeca str. Oregon]